MVYVFLAEGFEDTEAIATIDCLRRGGIDVVTVGIGGKQITSAHKITVIADISDKEAAPSEDLQMIVLPGGMPGTLNLEKSQIVQTLIDYCAKNKIYIAAICAAPLILGHKGLLAEHEAVCYPGYENDLRGADILLEPVCVCGNIITSRGAGTAMLFGLKLVELLVSKAVSDKISKGMIC